MDFSLIQTLEGSSVWKLPPSVSSGTFAFKNEIIPLADQKAKGREGIQVTRLCKVKSRKVPAATNSQEKRKKLDKTLLLYLNIYQFIKINPFLKANNNKRRYIRRSSYCKIKSSVTEHRKASSLDNTWHFLLPQKDKLCITAKIYRVKNCDNPKSHSCAKHDTSLVRVLW